MRADKRKNGQLRDMTVEYGVQIHAPGSVLIRCGNTHVLCAASVEEKVPPFLEGSGRGWITAEYRMLPASTNTRVGRDGGGRAREIQRLIGRSLRQMVDLAAIDGFTIRVDCDVVNADGGTRCASICGGSLAVARALEYLRGSGKLGALPAIIPVAAVSCGVVDGEPRLDLAYEEDSRAGVDANFVMAPEGRLIEVQATGEGDTFSRAEMDALLSLAEEGTAEIFRKFWPQR